MEVSYIRDLNYQYLVITDDRAAQSDEVGMLVNNRIPGLLNAHLQEVNGECQICYEITGLRPLSELYEGEKLRKKDITAILLHFARAVQETGRYLLRGESLLAEAEMIYVSDHLEEVRFCCCPTEQEDAYIRLGRLCRFFLDHIDYEDRECVRLAYDLFQESLHENATIESLLRHISTETEQGKGEDVNEPEEELKGNTLKREQPEADRKGKKRLRKNSGRLLSALTTACIVAMVIYGGLRLCQKLGLLNL